MSKRNRSNRADGESESAFSRGINPSLDSAGPEVFSLRARAPRDCCEKMEELLSALGFATSGIKEEDQKDGTWRYYFVSPVKQFRVKHVLEKVFPK